MHEEPVDPDETDTARSGYPPVRRRRRGGPVVLVVVLVVLAALAAVLLLGDRWLRGTVETQVGRGIQDELAGVTGEVPVTVHGWPVATQLLRGRLDDVTAHLETAEVSGVPVVDVNLRAQGVSTSTPLRIATGNLTATLPISSVQTLVDARTDADVAISMGDAALDAAVTVLGVDVVVELVPRVADGALAVDVVGATVGGVDLPVDDLPSGLTDRLQGIELPVEGLPTGLRITGVTVVGDGLRIAAAGTDVRLGAGG